MMFSRWGALLAAWLAFLPEVYAQPAGSSAPPTPPDGLTVTKGQEGWNSVLLEWKKSNGTYDIYRGTSPGGEEATPVAAKVATNRFVDHNLNEGNTYYYKVKATNPAGSADSNEASYRLDNPLYRDKTDYPPREFAWSTRTDIPQVRGVFPHLFLQQRAFVATQAGLLMSDDDGRTWTNLPEAAADKVGPITAMAFHPVQADTFYIASQGKGVWMTTDNGKTFTQIGTKAKGMASDSVADFIIYPGDAEHGTLLAVHGDAAQGISRSRDGGKSWDVVNTDYHFSRVFGGEGNSTQLYLFGATVKQPDIQSVYTTHTVGEYIAEVIRDVVPTDLVFAPVQFRQQGQTYVTTSDSGLIRIDNTSVFGMAYDTTKLAYPNVDGWASAGVTWGPTPESLNLFLFDPAKAGLVIATNMLSELPQPAEDISNAPASVNGLPVGPITGEGSVLRPNANGTVCYAVVNNALSIGRLPEDVPVVELNPGGVEANPNDDKEWRALAESFNKLISDKGSTLDAAKSLLKNTPDLEALYRGCQVAVTVQVPVKPAPPKSVTIDLSRYGGMPDSQLYDDGQHGDGAAGDGVYGLTFAFLPASHQPHNEDPEWRCLGPGRIALGVVATYADGKKRAAVGVINYLQKIGDLEMWNEGGLNNDAIVAEKGLTAEPFKNPLAPGQPAYAPRPHKGDNAVRLKVPKGPWTVHFKAAYNRLNIDSYAGMSFYVKLEQGDQPTELYLQLLDQPEFSAPTLTEKAPLLNGMKLSGEYQRVSLPMGRILGPGSHFQTDHLNEIIISGDSPAPATLDIDQMAAIATYPPSEPPPDPAQ